MKGRGTFFGVFASFPGGMYWLAHIALIISSSIWGFKVLRVFVTSRITAFFWAGLARGPGRRSSFSVLYTSFRSVCPQCGQCGGGDWGIQMVEVFSGRRIQVVEEF